MTCTVVDWIDVFTRKNHKLAIVDSLKYCGNKKGLNLFAWCLMPNHLHLIANCSLDNNLADVMRDFKQYTAKRILNQIEAEPESRREWMLRRFEFAGKFNKKITHYNFWQEGNHAIEVYSPHVTWQKINYIHQNPVKAMIVERAEEYWFSSARNYLGKNGLLDVHCIPPIINVI